MSMVLTLPEISNAVTNMMKDDAPPSAIISTHAKL
jgi:hypothetical protein